MDAFFERLVETSVDGIWVLDLEGRTIHANDATSRLLDCDRDQLMSLGVRDFLDEAGSAQFSAHLDDVRRGRLNTDMVEVRHRRRDGSDVWTMVTESPLRDDSGRLVALVHRLTDHAGAREVREGLTHDRAALSEAQKIARLCTWHWDIASDQLWGSAELCRIYDVDPAIFPMTYEAWNAAVHPEDRCGADTAVREALQGKDHFDYVVRAPRGDGVWLWTRSRGVVHRDEEGRAVQLVGTSQDVHEQRAAVMILEDMLAQNQLMQRLAAASNDSRTMAEALISMRGLLLDDDGWRRARAYLVHDGALHFSPVPDPDRDDAPDLEARHPVEDEVAHRAWTDGVPTWSEDDLTVAFPVTVQGETHAVVVLTTSDVTDYRDLLHGYVQQVGLLLARVVERETAARSLSVARDAAQHALRAKTDFLAMMTHEIRTPLNGVIGLNELLQRSSLTASQQGLCDGIGATGRHLLTLVNDILDFSKIEAGHLTLEAIDFDLRGSIESAAGMIGGQASSKGIDLCVVVDPALPHVVNADPTRLAQVVTNLTSNAVKFTDLGSVVVRVQAGPPPVDGTGVAVHLSVTDTGVGIPAEAQESIFAEFGQADASTGRTHGGTGLGLAICQRIVAEYGGRLAVESTLGGGSTFSCDLVLGTAAGESTNPLDVEVTAAWGGRTVVVLTRTAERFALVGEKLATWGPRLVHAASPAYAVAMAEEIDDLGAVVVDLAATGGVGDRLDEAALRRVLETVGDDVRVLLIGQDPGSVVVPAGTTRCVQALAFPVTSAALRIALTGTPGDRVDRRLGDVPSGPVARVLVVEDNQVNQQVATGMLELLGYEHDVAAHGGEALEVFDPSVHDLVLMDVQMPVLDGYETTRRLHEMHPGLRTPFVAMTANAVEGEQERCRAAGMVGYLTKPVEVQRFTAVLERHLRPGPPAAVTPEAHPWRGVREDLEGVIDTSRIDDLLEMGPAAIGMVTPAVSRLLSSLPEELERLVDAHRRRRQGDVVAVAHRMAGAALNLGVTGVGEAARSVEQDVRDGKEDARLEAMVAHLAREVERAVPALQQCLTALRAPDRH